MKPDKWIALVALGSIVIPPVVDAWSSMRKSVDGDAFSPPSRRSFLENFPTRVAVAAASIAISLPCAALDMDAFAQKELAAESCDDRLSKKCRPHLSEDEALCRFGQPSQKTGEACLRAGMSTKRPTGVDAFGKIDRGEYVRCKVKYEDDAKTNKLVKTWDCQ